MCDRRIQHDSARQFGIFDLEARQRVVNEQNFVVRRRLSQFQILDVQPHLAAAMLIGLWLLPQAGLPTALWLVATELARRPNQTKARGPIYRALARRRIRSR